MKNFFQGALSSSFCVASLIGASLQLNGCFLIAAGAGAEAGYVAAQDDRTVQETVNDQYLVSTIKTKLLADPEVAGLDINVDSFKATVILRGALRNQNEVTTALRLARETEGVQVVQSKLSVVK